MRLLTGLGAGLLLVVFATGSVVAAPDDSVVVSFKIKGLEKGQYKDLTKPLEGVAGVADAKVSKGRGSAYDASVKVTVEPGKTVGLDKLTGVIKKVNSKAEVLLGDIVLVGKVSVFVDSEDTADQISRTLRGVKNVESARVNGSEIQLEVKKPRGAKLSDLQEAAAKKLGIKDEEKIAAVFTNISWTAPKKKKASSSEGGGG